MGKSLVITEKPSVARDIVGALGGFTDHDGFFENDAFVVTFAVGHLFELLAPEDVDEKYKAWTLEVLPILPKDGLRIKPKKGHSERIRTIKKLALREDVDGFVKSASDRRRCERRPITVARSTGSMFQIGGDNGSQLLLPLGNELPCIARTRRRRTTRTSEE